MSPQPINFTLLYVLNRVCIIRCMISHQGNCDCYQGKTTPAAKQSTYLGMYATVVLLATYKLVANVTRHN